MSENHLPPVTQYAIRSAHGDAPGKVILCGEHSVVYGYPALAAPVSALRARAVVEAGSPGMGLRLVAADLGETLILRAAPAAHPLAAAARLTLTALAAPEPDATLTLRSELPIAAGLGSGAATAVALIRALGAYLGRALDAETVNALAYEVEKLHHGTPSGIDNTVIAWECPVYFIKGRAPGLLTIGPPATLLIANSGIPGVTRVAVAGVRARREAAPARYDACFARMGALAEAARRTLEIGDFAALGALFDENHALLQAIGVSLPELDALATAARAAGALGAKLTGAGLGGNIIALVTPAAAPTIAAALQAAGAAQVWRTTLGEGKAEG